jgi:hypothetical protein
VIPDGFYWVKVRARRPEVAERIGERWWFTGSASFIDEKHVVVLSVRLVPPSSDSATERSETEPPS